MKFIELIRNAFWDQDDKVAKHDAVSYEPVKKSLVDKYIRYDNIKSFEGVWNGSPKNLMDILLWPPNTFIVCAKFLDITGVYKRIVAGQKFYQWSKINKSQVEILGMHWGDFCLMSKSHNVLPSQPLMNMIYHVFRNSRVTKTLKELLEDQKFITELLVLMLACDEAFRDIDTDRLEQGSVAYRIIREQLDKAKIETERFNLSHSQHSYGTIHYKHFICQSGISLNSLSHKLAYIRPDITTYYLQKRAEPNNHNRVNMMIFPWPENIPDAYFTPVSDQKALEMDDYFGFFEYGHDQGLDIELVIEKIEAARATGEEIDVIIFPECAMSQSLSEQLAQAIFDHYIAHDIVEHCPTLISGIFRKSCDQQYGANALTVYFASQTRERNGKVRLKNCVQHKHHRWFLDRSQIINYNLKDVLAPNKKWWEYIEVPHRAVISLYCEKHDYQLSPLICEDLARQDPVGPVIRALGPTLIIALLLDGPQLTNRWPGRYASILADDPGAGVLSVTPLGMTLRSDGSGFPPSRVCALWSEPGQTQELELEAGKDAILLNLEKLEKDQWSADGRKARRTAFTYCGHRCF